MSVKTVPLSEVAEINPRLDNVSAAENAVSFLSMADVDANTGTTSSGEDRPFSEVSKGYTQFSHGDLLIAKITPCFENGKIAQAKLARPYGAGSTEFHVVRPDQKRLDCRFLLHFLRQPVVRRTGEMRMTGSAGQRRVPAAFVNDLRIPLLPLDAQRTIAAMLDQVESLRAKRRAAIALLDELAQSIFLDTFGDPAENPRSWEFVSLGDIIVDGPQNGLYKPQKFYGAGCRIVRIDSFYSGTIANHSALKRVSVDEGEVERYSLREGDIVVNRVNSIEYLGKSALVEGLSEPVVYESNMMRFSVDRSRADPAFVTAVLQRRHTYGQVVSAAKKAVNQASINQTDVKSLSLYLPPLDLQSDFVRRSAHVQAQKTEAVAHLAELDALFASLQDRAFRGTLWTEGSTPVA